MKVHPVARRTALAGASAFGFTTITGCGPFAAGSVASPAVSNFLYELGVSIAATATVDLSKEMAKETKLWRSVQGQISELFGGDSWSYFHGSYRGEGDDFLCAGFTSDDFAKLSEEEQEREIWRWARVAVILNPEADSSCFELPQWAWQGLLMFGSWFIDSKDADDRPQARALLQYALAPGKVRAASSQSPAGLVAWTGYQSKTGGYVDIAKLEREDHSFSVWVKVAGIPDTTGSAIVKEFELPTVSAETEPECKIYA